MKAPARCRFAVVSVVLPVLVACVPPLLQARNRLLVSVTYSQPADEVLSAAQQVLFGRGFPVKSQGTTSFQTEPRIEGGDVAVYLVQVRPAGGGRCVLDVTRRWKMAGNPSSIWNTGRDPDIEWDVLVIVDPAQANALAEQAEREVAGAPAAGRR